MKKVNLDYLINLLIYMNVDDNIYTHTHTHTYIYIYIYIYVYIVIHRETVSFYQNSSVWLDTQDAQSQDRNPPNFTLDEVLELSANKRATLPKGIFKVFI